jgi:4-amino-4-deoxy-L-arabinose transferase-like glycosyltransferase
MEERRFLVIVLLASLAIKVPLALTVTAFGVDESLYLATAKSLAETGRFGLADEYYDFKFIAPVFAMVASGFYVMGGEKAVLLISPVASTLTLLVLYLLGRRVGGDQIGRMSMMMGFFATMMVLFGTRPLTESTALLFFTSSLLFIHMMFEARHIRKRANLNETVFTGVAVILSVLITFLTRFQYGALATMFLAVLLVKWFFTERRLSESKESMYKMGVVAAAMFSVFLAAYTGGAGHQASTDVGFGQGSLLYIPYVFMMAGLFTPFVLYGLYRTHGTGEHFLIIAFFSIITAQMIFFGKVAEERYMLPILPVCAVLAAIGFRDLARHFGRIVPMFMVAVMILSVVAGGAAWYHYKNLGKYNETMEAVGFMKENCSSPVMSNSFSQVWYQTGFKNLPVQSDIYKSLELMGERGATCVMFSKHEAPFNDFFDGGPYARLVFESGGVSVYKTD